MKFFHLSDLHFGKQLHGYDLIEEQQKIIQDVIEAARVEEPDAIVIAGDVYDKSVPSGSAMKLLEELFLGLDALSEERKRESNVLSQKQKSGKCFVEQKAIEVLLIAGNHDSAPRLDYGSSFLERHHIHIAVCPPQEESERLQKVTLTDEVGEVNFYLLPYVSTGMLRTLAGDEQLHSADDAVRFLLEREQIDWSERNVLVSHQFYLSGGTEPKQCDSESPRLYVGGLDGVNTTTVEKFDYVALGHIHSPQKLGLEHIHYCGTPYAYSVSEAGQEKSITVVEMGAKGELSLCYLPFEPLRKVCKLTGKLQELGEMAGENGEKKCQNYVSITLTDEEPLEAPKDYLEHYYERILEIKIDNVRSRRIFEEEISDMQELTPLEAFRTFFADTAGREMTEQEETILQDILDEIECS